MGVTEIEYKKGWRSLFYRQFQEFYIYTISKAHGKTGTLYYHISKFLLSNMVIEDSIVRYGKRSKNNDRRK
jgi:hypothetical protein